MRSLQPLDPGLHRDQGRLTAAVEFEGVSRTYGDVKAVDRVSFSIRDGEFFSMLGPSGSGKTTCLRLIAGFETPSAGSIRIHGAEAAGVPPYERDVNTVFTSRSYGGTPAASDPWIRIEPALGVSKPAMSRRHVVLPEPEGPSMEKNSPSRIENDTRSTALTSPYVRLTPSNSTAAVTRP